MTALPPPSSEHPRQSVGILYENEQYFDTSFQRPGAQVSK